MNSYPHHSAEEMNRLKEIYYSENFDCTIHEIEELVAESNLRTLAWAREQIMNDPIRCGKCDGMTVPEHTLQCISKERIIKALTPESL